VEGLQAHDKLAKSRLEKNFVSRPAIIYSVASLSEWHRLRREVRLNFADTERTSDCLLNKILLALLCELNSQSCDL
jgi:hypothetical protein